MATNPIFSGERRAAARIARQLATMLRCRLQHVHVAKPVSAPPSLAFQVGFPRLSLTVAGRDEMELDLGQGPQTLSVATGQAVYVPPNAWNRPAWSQPVTVAHFLFGKTHLGISLVRHGGQSPEPARRQISTTHCALGEPIPALLHALNALTETRHARVRARLVEALIESSLVLLQAPPPTAPVRKAENTYRQICFYLQTHFQEPLTRDSVAAQFRVNPSHLSRLFRQEGLMSFVDYLTWVRTDRAKALLKHRELTLTEVAQRCGFADTAYFCRVFKQKTRQTPTAYRLK